MKCEETTNGKGEKTKTDGGIKRMTKAKIYRERRGKRVSKEGGILRLRKGDIQ